MVSDSPPLFGDMEYSFEQAVSEVDDGVVLGGVQNAFSGSDPAHLPMNSLRKGLYVVGDTGGGKTTLLHNIAYQLATDEVPFCYLDLKSRGGVSLIRRLPVDTLSDVSFVGFDRSDADEVYPFDLFEPSGGYTNQTVELLLSLVQLDEPIEQRNIKQRVTAALHLAVHRGLSADELTRIFTLSEPNIAAGDFDEAIVSRSVVDELLETDFDLSPEGWPTDGQWAVVSYWLKKLYAPVFGVGSSDRNIDPLSLGDAVANGQTVIGAVGSYFRGDHQQVIADALLGKLFNAISKNAADKESDTDPYIIMIDGVDELVLPSVQLERIAPRMRNYGGLIVSSTYHNRLVENEMNSLLSNMSNLVVFSQSSPDNANQLMHTLSIDDRKQLMNLRRFEPHTRLESTYGVYKGVINTYPHREFKHEYYPSDLIE